jgi:hypothetical protein
MTNNSYTIDILSFGLSSPDAYSVVLLGYRNRAAPQIFEITWEVLRDRLESVMAWHPVTLDNYEKQLKEQGRLTDVPLAAAQTQLQALGFHGL